MKSEIKNAIPKLTCGEESATAFMVSDNIAITATHAIGDYFDKEAPIKLCFNIDGAETQQVSVKPMRNGNWENLPIVALELEENVTGIIPIKCMDFKFNTRLKCETFGYPPARRNEGTPSEIYVIYDTIVEDYGALGKDWNLDLKKDDDLQDYSGSSGGPLLLKDHVVGVLLNQTQESGETSRLAGVSLYYFKEYFEESGLNLIEKTNDPQYEDYLSALQTDLENQLENTLSRKLSKSDSIGLGFTFKIANEKSEKLDSYVDLLSLDESAVILSEPGGGKTYLLSMLAKDMIINPLVKNNRIPVLLKARNWLRSYNTIVEGIKNELKYSMDIDSSQIEHDLREGKYLLLIDGLDEVINSVDLLIDELLRISKIDDMQIIVTCRKENYHDQFYSNFGEFTIEQLNDEQIREYVEKELDQSGWHFLHGIEGNLRSLLHNPLFLFMTVSILKNTSDRRLPKNKAELYSDYIEFLMEERPHARGLSNPFNIDSTTKEDILSDFAMRTFREIPERSNFVDSVCLYLDRGKIEIVKRELLETGILIEERGNLNFFHPSFHEYFTALCISKAADEELILFTKNESGNDSYFEVFIFLAGLLKLNNRQKILLDYLEKNNLYLYRRCLEARFDFTNQIKEEWSEEYTIEYFEQVRQSYLQIVDSHFNSIKYYFYPWSIINKEIQEQFEVVIEGSMDFQTPAINFRFLGIEKTSESPRVIVKNFEGNPKICDQSGKEISAIISMNFNDSWYLNLGYGELGIDSAREVALHSLKKQIAEILDKQMLFDIEPPEMLVMQIENTLRKLPISFGIRKGKEIFNLSLYTNSVDEIYKVLLERNIIGYMHSLNDYGYLTGLDVARMYLSLSRLKELKNLIDYLLPKQDIGWEELQTDRAYIWDFWSDKQLSIRIARFFESYQLSYRYLVENCFSSIKNSLPFYAIGPVKFNIVIKREKTSIERVFNHGGGIDVTWEPVQNIEDIKTNISENHIKTENILEYHKQLEKDASQSLSRLGRKKLPFSVMSSSLLSLYIMEDDKLREDVYDRLKKDLGYILGDLK